MCHFHLFEGLNTDFILKARDSYMWLVTLSASVLRIQPKTSLLSFRDDCGLLPFEDTFMISYGGHQRLPITLDSLGHSVPPSH